MWNYVLRLIDGMWQSLEFIASHDRFNTYLTMAGDALYLAPGSDKRFYPLHEINIQEVYDETMEWLLFREQLAEMLTDPGDALDVGQCDDCYNPHLWDEMREVDGGRNVCESCLDEYTLCTDCEQYSSADDIRYVENCDRAVCDSCIDSYSYCDSCEEHFRYTTDTLSGSEVCERCRDNYYAYCEECDGYYCHSNSEGDDHAHDDSYGEGCCESPQTQFTIRNDGNAPLMSDTRATITLPAGVISDEGIGDIANYLRNAALVADDAGMRQNLGALSYCLDSLGNKWQTTKGNYTKRLSRLAYQTYGVKLSPEIVSRVGCIASDHSRAVNFEIETTRELNMSAYDFGHSDSCYWKQGSYSNGVNYTASRCALKTNGAFGIRTFDEYGNVAGRAWVFPLRKTESGALVPTFETNDASAFVVFNGYGNLDGYTPARILSHMAGMTYRRVCFNASPMWINSDVGYLVAPEVIADDYTDGSLCLDVDIHSDLFATERMAV